MPRIAMVVAIGIVVAIGLVGLSPCAAQEAPGPAEKRSPALFRADEAEMGRGTLAFSIQQARAYRPGDHVDTALRLPDGTRVELRLRRFAVTTAETRYVVVSADGERALEFEPAEIAFFRGHVREVVGQDSGGQDSGERDSGGRELGGSDVFLALSEVGSTGWIDLGPGRSRWALSDAGPGGVGLPAGRLSVFATLGVGAQQPAGEHCAFEHGHADDRGEPLVNSEDPGPPPVVYRPGFRIIELAIETDYEYFARFGDAGEAAAYVTKLYAAVSSLYAREVNAGMALTFVRIWTTPDDLFNEPDPLSAFRNYWNANMRGVPRDAAQLLSGRRDLPYGGVASLSALCTTNGYSVSGYTNGSFATPDAPNAYNQDIEIPAHELGHNCGALHTDGYGIDNCPSTTPTPQRGSLMSYCSQTVSGGTAVFDPYFHTTVRSAIRNHFGSRNCLAFDCNQNGISDAADIASGASVDVNSNGVPDECEDCNGNGVLDAADIAGGTSGDVNGNGQPDECEADCNQNGVPDSVDISTNFSRDDYHNGVPDECEGDCDGDGESDYTQIQHDMALDVDRDARLDACQDCDADGVTDIEAIGGANGAWVASTSANVGLRKFYPVVGTLMRVAVGGSLLNGQDVAVRDDLSVLVSSADNSRVIQYDAGGQYVGDFVPEGSGGLRYPTGIVFGPNGNLFVCSRDTNNVLEYDGFSGVFVREFVAGGAGGLVAPFGLVFRAGGGLLLVTSDDGRVLEFDGQSGALVREFVSAGDNGGLSEPRGMALLPNGNLLVASHGTNRLLEFDAISGAFVRVFNVGGTSDVLVLDGPWGVRIGPDGNVHASRNRSPRLHVTTTRIFVYEADSGLYLRSYILGTDTGLFSTSGFAFIPDQGRDCNRNLVPDACDVSRGTSGDCNANGVPDECEISPACDVNCDGSVNAFDIQAMIDVLGGAAGRCSGCAADTNGDGTANGFDINGFVACLR